MASVKSIDYVPSDNEEENSEITPSKVGKYGANHVFGRKKYGKNASALQAARDKRRSASMPAAATPSLPANPPRRSERPVTYRPQMTRLVQ